MNNYLQPIPNAAVNMIKRKSEVIFESIWFMKDGDGVWIKKEDLSSFYNVCRVNGIKVVRRKQGEGFLMGIKHNGYLADINKKKAQQEAQRIAERGPLHDEGEEGWE